MKRRMLDTDTLSFVLKQREPIASRAKDYILENGDMAISVISFYEILRGLKFIGATRQIQAFEEFARTNAVFPLDAEACRRAADIHASLRASGILIEDADLLIAAIALANDCVLVTNNTAHFNRISSLELENWVI